MLKFRKILFWAFYLLAIVILVEGTSRFVLLKTSLMANRPIECDSWFRIELIKHLQNSIRRKTLLTGNFGHACYHPLRGWSMFPNIHEAPLGSHEAIQTNSKGIRANVEYSYQKAPSKTRILVLGDSFTFGAEVGNTETYPYCLQEMLPHAEVINLGVNGYGHDQMLLYLKEEGMKYHPDIVILGFLNDDRHRNLLNIRHFPKPRYELDQNKLTLTNVPVPTLSSLYKNEFFRPKFIDLINILYAEIQAKLKVSPSTDKITAAILDEIITTINGIKAKPVFVFIPFPQEVQQGAAYENGDPEKFFRDYCQTRHLNCLSTDGYFNKAVSRGSILKTEGHWDSTGNQIIAAAIRDYLLKAITRHSSSP